MKAILEYTLPDDNDAWLQAVRSGELYRAAWEFSEYLRSQYKYVEPEERDDIVAIRERWFEIMGDLLE